MYDFFSSYRSERESRDSSASSISYAIARSLLWRSVNVIDGSRGLGYVRITRKGVALLEGLCHHVLECLFLGESPSTARYAFARAVETGPDLESPTGLADLEFRVVLLEPRVHVLDARLAAEVGQSLCGLLAPLDGVEVVGVPRGVGTPDVGEPCHHAGRDGAREE